MAPLTCPECNGVSNDTGMCIKCDLDLNQIYRKFRHEQALEKLREQNKPKPVPPVPDNKSVWD